MTEMRETEVKAKMFYKTREEIVDQLKAIGQAIITDAEHIAIDPHDAYGIHIMADIYPAEKVKIKYVINRYADSQKQKEGDTDS